MKLHYCETLNPRKACVVARHLQLPVEYVRVDLARGEHRRPPFLLLNPNGRVPVLEEDGQPPLWEANAIMCRLSDLAGADLWPHDHRQIEVMRWLSWDMQHFSSHAGVFYFEHLIKPHIGLGEPDAAALARAAQAWQPAAVLLDTHLRDRPYVVGDTLTVADIALGNALAYATASRLPLDGYAGIQRWLARLNELPAWRDPFPALAAS